MSGIYVGKILGKTWKYYQARICDEMPSVDSRSKQWFLFEKVDDKWEYDGFYPTIKALHADVKAR